jgi:hypothetical protein
LRNPLGFLRPPWNQEAGLLLHCEPKPVVNAPKCARWEGGNNGGLAMRNAQSERRDHRVQQLRERELRDRRHRVGSAVVDE